MPTFPRFTRRPLLKRIFHAPDGGRSYVLETDYQLQTGPVVQRIPHDFNDLTQGITGSRFVRGWPETGDSIRYMKHLRWARIPGGVSVVGKQSDDSATIPATYIGNTMP